MVQAAHQNRSQWGKAVRGLGPQPLQITGLPVAGADVVTGGNAKNINEGLRRADTARPFAYHHHHFTFKMNTGSKGG